MVLLIGLFFSFAVFLESFGVFFRLRGVYSGKKSLGYSGHVRTATLGRLFIIAGAPLLGYWVDIHGSFTGLVKIGLFTYLMNVLMHIFLLSNFSRINARVFISVYGKKVDTANIYLDWNVIKSNYLVALSAIFTISLQSLGIFIVNGMALKFVTLKATVVQLSGVITMLGTTLHTFIVDPWLSRQCDLEENALSAVWLFLFSRLIGLLVNLCLFIFLSVIIS